MLMPNPAVQLPLQPEVITAMDALNSYARAGARWHRALRAAIYAMKDQAVRAADHAGLVCQRPIEVVVKCRTCEGTGEYRGYSTCRRCGGDGFHPLRFTETRIGRTLKQLDWPLPDLVWHSPRFGSDPAAELVSDWKPNGPGRDMTVDQLCAALNIVEPKLTPFYRSSAFEAYSIGLGRSEGRCDLCGSIDDLSTYHIERGRISWTATGCESCRRHWYSMKGRYSANLIFDRFKVPENLLTDNIRAWAERHGGLEKLMNPSEVVYEWDAA